MAVKCRVRTPAVVKGQVPLDPSLGRRDGVVRMQIDLFVLDRLPQPLDEHVVAPRTAPVHADADLMLLQNLDEARGRKLRSLVGVEDLRCPVPGDRLLERLDAKISRYAVRD